MLQALRAYLISRLFFVVFLSIDVQIIIFTVTIQPVMWIIFKLNRTRCAYVDTPLSTTE
jgi:hypothetical protein